MEGMDADAHSSCLAGYTDSANSADHTSRALCAFSTSSIGATVVGRDVGGGGACFDWRTAASALGKKTRRLEGIGQQAEEDEPSVQH
jgi:hypothetical protein